MKGINNITIPKNNNNKLKTREDPSPFGIVNNSSQVVSLSKFEGNIQKALQFYSAQVTKLTYQNTMLNNNLRVALRQKKQLADYIAKFEEQEHEDTEEKKKRIRRCANQIQRNYICPVTSCSKSYGTEGSLAQHLKFKHPEINQGEGNQENGNNDMPSNSDKQSPSNNNKSD